MTDGGPAAWRVLRDPPTPGARNMAVDEALARHVEAGEGVLRLYRWSAPTVSFGRNQVALGRYSADAARHRGVDLVRRPTGGRAVWHQEELTYSVVAPLRSFGGIREAYAAIHRGIVAGLRSLGVQADVAQDTGPVPGPAAEGTCFIGPAPGEVVVGHRKVVGSAQVRVRRALLQHGSILLEGRQGRLRSLTLDDAPPGEDADTSATLSEFLAGPPPVEDVVEAVSAGLRDTLGGDWRAGGLTPAEESTAAGLVERYASSEWTWRR